LSRHCAVEPCGTVLLTVLFTIPDVMTASLEVYNTI
jgi:hypothetical protein